MFQVIVSLLILVAALPSKRQDPTPQIQLFETYLGLEVQHGEAVPIAATLVYPKINAAWYIGNPVSSSKKCSSLFRYCCDLV